MKKILIAAAVAATTLASISVALPALADNVGLSVSIGQPGFYGQINIGGYAQPEVVYAQPIAVEQVPQDRAPIYLRVPQYQSAHWQHYCHTYKACGERVLFVKDGWYRNQYAPRYLHDHHDHHDMGHDDHHDDHHDMGHDMGHDHHDDHHDNGHDGGDHQDQWHQQ
jgi:hypothetical protein